MQVKKSQQHWNTVSGPAIVYTYIYSMFEKLRSNATPTSLGLLPRQVPSGKACRAHCSWVCREHRLGRGSKCWLTNWWSWCPLESSSCVNEHQSKAANSQAKSHTCNQGNVLPPAEVSVFIFRLCHNQFLLPSSTTHTATYLLVIHVTILANTYFHGCLSIFNTCCAPAW